MLEWRIDRAPGAGIVDEQHAGDGEATEDVERHESFARGLRARGRRVRGSRSVGRRLLDWRGEGCAHGCTGRQSTWAPARVSTPSRCCHLKKTKVMIV